MFSETAWPSTWWLQDYVQRRKIVTMLSFSFKKYGGSNWEYFEVKSVGLVVERVWREKWKVLSLQSGLKLLWSSLLKELSVFKEGGRIIVMNFDLSTLFPEGEQGDEFTFSMNSPETCEFNDYPGSHGTSIFLLRFGDACRLWPDRPDSL